MKPGSPRYKDVPLEIVGSTKFSRYNKMSSEQTFNMMISDDWLVPFAGYKRIALIAPRGEGRGIYSSAKLNRMFAVIDNTVYSFDESLTYSPIGHMSTFEGDVFIAENNAGEIAFSDRVNIYIYNSVTSTFTVANTTGFTPGYLTFQDSRFISPDTASNSWTLSGLNNGTSWDFTSAQRTGGLQTKPDRAVACIRFPGRGNLLLVFGETVAEQWYDVGAQLFPYQRSQSTNIDYGCINPATIAESENIVCWIAANEKSGPVIMYTNGGEVQRISTDGIDFKLSNLTDPYNCYGFIFRQDGHIFYVATWPTDRLSYAFDFNTQKFFTLCDENMNSFIAKKVAFFNNEYYFVSLKDGNLYQLGSQFESYDYGDGVVYPIPRIRICPPIMSPDQSRFIAGYAGFTIEQGQFHYNDVDTSFNLTTESGLYITAENTSLLLGGGENFRDNVPRIDLSLSKDGGVNFGSNVAINMRPSGKRANRLMWWRLGSANDLVMQFRFYGFSRFVCNNGVVGLTQ